MLSFILSVGNGLITDVNTTPTLPPITHTHTHTHTCVHAHVKQKLSGLVKTVIEVTFILSVVTPLILQHFSLL